MTPERNEARSPLQTVRAPTDLKEFDMSSITQMARFGATPTEWKRFVDLGLESDLLPVVANPAAKPSPHTTITGFSKTPSEYNPQGLAHGIKAWPTKVSTARDIERWSAEPDLALCVIGRTLKAIDVDVEDAALSAEIREFIEMGSGVLPCRMRANTGKLLLAVRMPGDMAKRAFKVKGGGIVEFLGHKQQFLLCGMHKSGVRYHWVGGLPAELPEMTAAEFEVVWQALVDNFALPDTASTEGTAVGGTKPRRASDADGADVAFIRKHWEVRGEESDGRLHVRCPNADEHSADQDSVSGTTYTPAGVGRAEAGFKCHHAHCAHITATVFQREIGFAAFEIAAAFEVVELTEAQAAECAGAVIRNAQKRAVAMDDFWAYLPDHKYIFTPTGAMWPAASVDGAIKPWPKNPADPKKRLAPSKVLDRERAVQQMTWLPGAPQIIENKVMLPTGWSPRPGARVFNRYMAPVPIPGDARQAGPWLDHLRAVYPNECEHLIKWFAHRVRHPGEKLNHALVLGGDQGIGKDSILVPIKHGVGASNCEDISPGALMGSFNGFAASVLLVVSEARDLGDADRFKLYEHSKTYICAPPEVLRVNEKHLKEYYVPNLCGVVFTTNHRTSGLYLPADDRRHFVAWSEAKREQFAADYFPTLYQWYATGGVGHVLAYLESVDLYGFDPKAAPVKTPAFWAMVAAGESPEASELRDLIVALGSPDVLTVGQLIDQAHKVDAHEFGAELGDRKHRTRLPHMLDRVGYAAIRSPYSKDGRFGKLFMYGKQSMSQADQIAAAKVLEAALRTTPKQAANAGASAADFA
jgi:hypothetical protein